MQKKLIIVLLLKQGKSHDVHKVTQNIYFLEKLPFIKRVLQTFSISCLGYIKVRKLSSLENGSLEVILGFAFLMACM